MSGEEGDEARPWVVLAPGVGREALSMGRPPESVARALAALTAEGAREETLEALALEGGVEAAAWWQVLLRQLTLTGAVHHVARGPEGEWARLESTRPVSPWVPLEPEPARPLRLSRFAYLRREGPALVLESPQVPARLVLAPRALPLVALLAEPLAFDALAAQLPPGARPGARATWTLLARTGLAVEAEADGTTPEERDPRLAPWEFHDLLFHARTRHRWREQPLGGTYRFEGVLPPPPVLKPSGGPRLALPRPDLERLRREDPPLAEVMERRRSCRQFGREPPTRAQLGELLYRCVRLRALVPGERQMLSSRPHPSGGALYALELYAAVHACQDLEPGLYRYEPGEHALERLGGPGRALERLLAVPWGGAGTPPILLTLAARFPRVTWKYQSIAYAVILKEAGVVLQSLSLGATALGLGACPLGFGDAEAFERAAGTDGLLESSVAELAIGALPPGG